jgi:hypothetical protein
MALRVGGEGIGWAFVSSSAFEVGGF